MRPLCPFSRAHQLAEARPICDEAIGSAGVQMNAQSCYGLVNSIFVREEPDYIYFYDFKLGSMWRSQ